MNKKLFFVLFCISICFIRPSYSADYETAPLFKLQDIDQDAISLDSYKNRPVLLIFWTTWCPMCPSELKDLNNNYTIFKKDGIDVLAINSGELADEVSDFVNKYYLAYRILLDKDTLVTRAYGIENFPTYVLINSKGKIVFTNNYSPLEEYKKLISDEEGG